MIIDFHTHIFPDKIAEKTIEYLMEKGDIPSFSDGKASTLITKMTEAGVDISVILPAMTNPKQFESINRFAMEINEQYKNCDKRLISFGGIHPDCENIEGKMKFIKDSGFVGIKIHPDYQGTYINDEKYIRILEYAKEFDLVVVTHAGFDCGFKGEPIKCTPSLSCEVIKKVNHKKLVLAHLGGNEMLNESIEKLCGLDVYLDTAYVLNYVDKETFCKFIEKHGADKILFASDTPWSDIKSNVEKIKSFGLDKNIENKILYENAKNLLGI
ncbi:MAG: amidohydrolase family protein [Clostridia bacterium]|nr:amidohydrolase family protein [Clostridia bacterium]